ncbi:hypothetical protein EDD85DRAFT_941607 [Armillaria nabsnona]|nr:hypothetical protein EDD85DRAFT_941607 [Armillaria nabsnona]
MYDYKAGNHWDSTLHNKDEYQTLNITHGQETGSVEYGRGYQESLSQISRPRIWVIWMKRSAQGGTELEKGRRSSGRLKEDADRGVTQVNLPRVDADPERRPVLIKGRLGGYNEVKWGCLKVHAHDATHRRHDGNEWKKRSSNTSRGYQQICAAPGVTLNSPWEKERSDVKRAQTLDPPVDIHPPVYIDRIWFSGCGVTRERVDRPNADSLGLVSKRYFQIEMSVDLERYPFGVQFFLLAVVLLRLPNVAEKANFNE